MRFPFRKHSTDPAPFMQFTLDASSSSISRHAEKGRIDDLEEALRAAPEGAVNLVDAHGFTPLMHAITEGHAAAVRVLLSYGAATDTRNLDGETALHLAASIGYEECVSLLLMHGADPSLLTTAGKSAAELAFTMGHHEILRALEQAAPATVVPIESETLKHKDSFKSTTIADDPRDLAFTFLETDFSKLNDDSLGEMKTILEMTLEKVVAEEQLRQQHRQ